MNESFNPHRTHAKKIELLKESDSSMEKKDAFEAGLANTDKAVRFHHKRWEQKANEAKNNPLNHVLFRRRLTPEFHMLREAKDEDRRFKTKNKERSKIELRESSEMRQKVFANMYKRAEEGPGALNENGEKIKTLIYIMPGGRNCATAAGAVIGLDAAGLGAESADVVVGASSGAVVATAFVSGTDALLQGTKMHIKELSTKRFIDKSRLFRGQNGTIDINLVAELMGPDGQYPIDDQAIADSDTELAYVTTVEDEDGELHVNFIDAKTTPSKTEAIRGTMGIPGITGGIAEIDGKKHYDGGFHDPLPLAELIEKYEPTDILVISQSPFDPTGESRGRTMVADEGLRNLPTQVELFLEYAKGGLKLQNRRRQAAASKTPNIAIFHPPDGDLSVVDIDSNKAKSAVLHSYHAMIEDIGAPANGAPREIPLDDLYEAA